MSNTYLKDTQPSKPAGKNRNYSWILWVLFAFSVFLILGMAGTFSGYRAGLQEERILEATRALSAIQEQFNQGLEDYQAGLLDLARQRFEWVISQDPSFPGAADNLAEVMSVLFATTTPTSLPPTPTLTPTPDMRPVEDLLNQVKSLVAGGEWDRAVDTIVNLRKVDPSYRVTEVDGLLYLILRNRGVDRIRAADLEGGSYDLALAERFGPLDAEATNYRELARLYMYGSSFWEAYPEQAVYYFGQVASAAPGLRDASGWTASERYRAALIQYGDQLARSGDWCAAQAQYNLALSFRDDAQVVSTLIYAEEQCFTPTPTFTSVPSETPTPTFTNMPTETLVATPSATLIEIPSPTFTLPAELTSTYTPEVTLEPSPIATSTPELLPTETAPAETGTPTETPTPESLLITTTTPSISETISP